MTDLTIRLNGEAAALPAGSTLTDLLARRVEGRHLDRDAGVAVAVDGAVVPRSGWSTHVLVGGESVEVVTAVQGG